ncbi:MAG: DUF459 domain-containing protein [Myxococcales bacterium]|nr:DUF459 domain-containing protein [Myxococcales bacterium]
MGNDCRLVVGCLFAAIGGACQSGAVSAGATASSVAQVADPCSTSSWDDTACPDQRTRLLASLELPLGDNPVAKWPQALRKKPRILILGDSFVATDFGLALQRLLNKEFAVDARRRGRSSTGLARPDYFDWMSEGTRQVRRHRPDMVIVILGGNDGQDLIMESAVKKGRIRWRSRQWEGAYAKRVQEFIDTLTKGQFRRLLWVGLPTMALPSLERKLETIRAIQKRVVNAHPRGSYVDTGSWFHDRFGRPRESVTLRKRELPLRQEDGVHFSRPGAIWFAQRIAPVIAVSLADG